MASRPLFILIDGHAVAYRQYFALPVASFSTRGGEPTNATFGFARILMDILQKDKPDYIAVSFDMGMSGRDTLYAEYKGTREKMEDDLRRQVTRIMELVRAFNMPLLAVEGYEADDVIGTTVRMVKDETLDVRIITGDRDILQLLSPNVTVQLPSRNGPDTVYDEAMFREKWGLEPLQLVDLKALMGDTSDNIPGVKGIGEKTATTLLQTYSTLDGIYEHIEEVKGALKTKLVEGRDMAYLSQELARIQQDVPISLNLPDCVSHDYDKDKVAELFRELEFRSLSDRLQKMGSRQQLSLFDMDVPASASTSDEEVAKTVIVQDEEALQKLVDTLNSASAIVWDTETTSTDQMLADLVGIALAVDTETGYYIPVGHQEGLQLPMTTVIDALRPVMTNPNIPKYAHNASYDLVLLQRYGIDVAPITFDTMVAEWMRDTTSKFLGLKNFANQYLKVQMTEITELIGTGKKQITMDSVAIERCAPYAAADAAITFRAVELLKPELEKYEKVYELFNTLEMPLVPVIAAMEQAGVVLDTQFLGQFGQELAVELAQLEQKIHDASGMSGFNINSPKQLNDLLFNKLQLSVEGLKKTQHGYSTDAATLENLRDKHPVVGLILQHRELMKLKGTYVDALPALVNPKTGRVHTSFNQTGSSTGRFSSSNPNLQNIPIRTEQGRKVRRAFVAPKGKLLLSADYSQIELRILAHISQDATLLEAFHQEQDIHKATAAAVYGVELEDVTYEQRSFAKRVNFGLIYGMGAYRLARDSDLTLSEARAFIDTYFERLPGVLKYLDETKQMAYKEGYVQTLFGRRGEFGVLRDSNASIQIRQGMERAAINMPIQGTAADIMKRAMIDLHHELSNGKLNAMMILQVHDELVLEVPENQVEETRDLVVTVMERACELDAPLRANAQAGLNWREMQPV